MNAPCTSQCRARPGAVSVQVDGQGSGGAKNAVPGDPDLVRGAQGGCDACKAALARRYGPRLVRYLWQWTGQHHDAEDLAQDALVLAFERLGHYDARYAFSTWLFTVARRLALSQRRRRRPVALTDEMAAQRAHPGPGPCGLLIRAEAADRLWQAARQLRPRQFEALWLRYAEDLSIADVARVMGVTQVHVKVTLHRARRAMAARLEPEPAALSGAAAEAWALRHG